MKLFIKSALIVVYIFIAAEFFLRFFSPVPMLPRYIAETGYGIRGNQPSTQYFHKTPDYKVHFKINSKGVRADREIPYKKSEGTKRIIVLGDSFGMGYGVDLNNTFTETASRLINKKGIKNEIVNLSVSGHGNAEELVALTLEGLKYDPDLVLLQFHQTDFVDNVRSKLYKIENDSLVRDAKTYLPAVRIREKLFSYPIYRWLAGNCHLYNWIRDKAGGKTKKILATIRGIKNAKIKSTENDSLKPDDFNEKESEKDLSYKYTLTIAILEEMKFVCESANAGFIILEIPRRVKRDEFFNPIRANVREQLNEFYVLSPLTDFQAYKGQLLYWENSHGHFTPLGCEIVGNLLANFIIENNLLSTKL
mgnify:CR=1 FL=1